MKPDSNLDSILSDPVRAFHEIFGSEKREAGVADLGWKNHLFCQVIYSRTFVFFAYIKYMVVSQYCFYQNLISLHWQAIVIAELCAWGTGSDLFENLEILKKRK